MADSRRTYIDPTGENILFYMFRDGGWDPDLEFLEEWRSGGIWVYRPLDHPDLFVTVPDGRVWPLMTVDEAAAIRSFPEKPWILGEMVIDRCTLEMIPESLSHYPPRAWAIQDDATLMTLALAASADSWNNQSTNSGSTIATPLPSHIVATLLRCAEAEGLACSITMEPVTVANGAVTACGHYFQKAAVERWLTDRGTCPECRQPTAI